MRSVSAASEVLKPFEKRESDRAVGLIKQHGVFVLGTGDGCACTDFAVCGFTVNVSCHKSHGVIEVSARHVDITQNAVREVAKAVARDLAKRWGGREYIELLKASIEAGDEKIEMEAVDLL